MRGIAKRLSALERPLGDLPMRCHCPDVGGDHGKALADADAGGYRLGIVHFPGINDEGLDEFCAVAGRRPM